MHEVLELSASTPIPQYPQMGTIRTATCSAEVSLWMNFRPSELNPDYFVRSPSSTSVTVREYMAANTPASMTEPMLYHSPLDSKNMLDIVATKYEGTLNLRDLVSKSKDLTDIVARLSDDGVVRFANVAGGYVNRVMMFDNAYEFLISRTKPTLLFTKELKVKDTVYYMSYEDRHNNNHPSGMLVISEFIEGLLSK